MAIIGEDWYLKIGLDDRNAQWSLLVIDDRWDDASRMVRGFQDSYNNRWEPGIGEKCFVLNSINAYWEDNYPPLTRTFEKTLLEIPWIVRTTGGCSAITFCNFPSTLGDLEAKLKVAEAGDDDTRYQLAVLIDLWDDSVNQKKERFLSTWEWLNQLQHPVFARAKFTQGGIPLPIWTNTISEIPKNGTLEKKTEEFRKWFRGIRGLISNALYECTDGCCHSPTELRKATLDDRQRICKQLSAEDNYGVWRWCAEEAAVDPLPETALHRWLAGKAFQTSSIDSEYVPVTAVIGICEGAKYLNRRTALTYPVKSALYNILTSERDSYDSSRFRIDSTVSLGSVVIEGTYGAFAIALRDWLIHPEQFEPGSKYLKEVQVDTDSKLGKAYIRLVYSGDLPEAITKSEKRTRIGRVCRAWDRLAVFAMKSSHNLERLNLVFRYEG
jgi:hypothetical protein